MSRRSACAFAVGPENVAMGEPADDPSVLGRHDRNAVLVAREESRQGVLEGLIGPERRSRSRQLSRDEVTQVALGRFFAFIWGADASVGAATVDDRERS